MTKCRPRAQEDSRRLGWVQVTLDVLVWDGQSDLEMLALVAALAAMRNAGLPVSACPGASRVARIQGGLVANPSAQQLAGADASLLYGGAGGLAILMHMQVWWHNPVFRFSLGTLLLSITDLRLTWTAL